MPADLSYDLDGFLFGVGSDFHVNDLDMGEVEIRNNDAAMPRQDGIRFGRDTRGGRTLTFVDVLVMTSNGTDVSAQDAFARFTSAWRANLVRSTPGAVSILKLTRGGRTRRVYGRPRRFAPASERNRFGWFSADADFQCVDDLFYSDAELTTSIGMTVPSVGGLVGPLIGPIDAESAGSGVESLFVGGTEPAWVSVQIHGPIIDPSVEVEGQWSFKLAGVTLASDEWVLVDPSPWNRTVQRSNGANMGGYFTQASQRLSDMRIAPGPTQIILRGTDPTNTAYAQSYVREAYASY